MIQYKYFHTGEQYVSKLSVDRNNEMDLYYDNNKLFNKIRESLHGNVFTYGYIKNEFIMAESNEDNSLYFKGLRGSLSEITQFPIQYAYKLIDKEPVSDSDKASDILPQGKLPNLGRGVVLSIDTALHHIFSKLFDALVYGDTKKQILIITDSDEKSKQYFSVLSMLLPVPFMKRIGFCIGSLEIPNEPIRIVDSQTNEVELPIKVWLPRLRKFNYEAYKDIYYVFDVQGDKERDNYDKELSKAAKILEELNLSNDRDRAAFADRIKDAFTPEGEVDRNELDRISTIYMFETKHNRDSAEAVLAMGASCDEYVLEEVIRWLCQDAIDKKEPLSAHDSELIEKEYVKNEYVAQATDDELFEYNIEFPDKLSSGFRAILLRQLAKDSEGNRLRDYLNSALLHEREIRKQYSALMSSFSVLGDALLCRLNDENFGLSVRENSNFLQEAISFFDINERFGLIPPDQFSGEELFNVIAVKKNEDLKKQLVAILMASAYCSKTPVEFCEVRTKGLKKLLSKSGYTRLEQLEFILGVRSILWEIVDECGDQIGLDSRFDFIFNCNFGRTWVQAFLKEFSLSELLQADNLVRFHSAQTTLPYESMQKAIRKILLNTDYVKKNIFAYTNQSEREKYEEFFASLPQTDKNDHNEISTYLESIAHESRITDEFARYRYDFELDCYSTLREADKKKVNKAEPLPTLDETGTQEIVSIVEQTIAVFGTVNNKKKGRAKRFSSIGIWSFFWSVLSLIILCLPAIVIPASLGTFDGAHILGKLTYYFLPIFCVVPLLIYFFSIIVYSGLKKRDGNPLDRANKITFIFTILPVICFVAAYIVFYFVHFELPFGI